MGDWPRRIEERFASLSGSGSKASELQSSSSLDKSSTLVTVSSERILSR